MKKRTNDRKKLSLKRTILRQLNDQRLRTVVGGNEAEYTVTCTSSEIDPGS